MAIESSPSTSAVPLIVATAANRHTVRWYLMVYPYGRRGLTDGLEKELERRRRDNEPLFEYFAPTFTQTKEVDGRLVSTKTSLLFNYFFIHASENEVYRMKKNQPQYNFLPRVNHTDGTYHYPYVSDDVIRTLQWIARSYEGFIPLYTLDQTLLVRGDRIRIVKGKFKGVEARIVTRPSSPDRDVMVFVDNWMCVPLMNVRPNQYEVIGINDTASLVRGSHGLDNQQLSQNLHEALCRRMAGEATPEDLTLASDAFRRYSTVVVDSTILRCKLYSFLLPACRILDYKDKLDGLIAIINVMLPKITAEQSLALLMVTLYGCTDNVFFHDKAHALVDPWSRESAPKKSKQLLIRRLADYDRILKH